MAEDGLQSGAPRRASLGAEEGDSEPSMLLQKLKSNISKNVQVKVDAILQDVQRFSDNDKLYLYLQLPSGPGTGEKSSSTDPSSFSMADQLHTCNWIRSHLEEHADTCLPKQDVYETYKRHCDNLHYRPLSAANFGKIIRDIFPNIKARRLGGRGQSKYCYSGIRRKTLLNMPLLPNLDLKNDPSELTELVQTYKQEVTEAACELICDWAEKILKRSFDTVVEIARFLVQEHIVNPRCSQAELVTSATLAGGPAKPHKVIKKTSAAPRGGGADGEGSGPENKKDKDRGEQASSGKPTPSEKGVKGGESGRSGGRDLQVEAVMKRFPQLLPRCTDKGPLPVCSSPATLAPKDMKVTLPIAMATLPQQQGATLPFMILPSNMSLSYSERERATTVTAAPASTAPGPLQRHRATPKRAPELVVGDGVTGPGGAPPKRKRGRPRKPRPEDAAPAATTVSGGVIQKALPASSVPSQHPQSEVMEIVIQDQQGHLLGTLPPAPDPQMDLSTEEPSSVVVQCYTSGTSRSSPSTQATPYNVLLFQGPAQSLKPPVVAGWEAGRANVEVIQRAPVAREGRAQTEAPASALDAFLEKDEVEITLTPVDSLSDCPQPGESEQTNTP
ncbi:DNA-binding protein RFX5 [Scleropages formosus]|uniref:Regulatory factor X, 5 n=1 Tax=Scleropages formosus TaxID=113540 RepID=A0A8C9R261_SCLFO|nr:DNA-binding protein RFX5 [Scleropages formosus]XP_029103860.1 DNA-binding protein RFX5 [Scleropages formosus]